MTPGIKAGFFLKNSGNSLSDTEKIAFKDFNFASKILVNTGIGMFMDKHLKRVLGVDYRVSFEKFRKFPFQ